MNKKVIGVGYIRVSTTKQADEGVSLDVQRQKVISLLKEQGCQTIKIYADEGKSARDEKVETNFLRQLITQRLIVSLISPATTQQGLPATPSNHLSIFKHFVKLAQN
ncbi:MAG: hypothetical protein TR69_WS6001000896 [candidate division WS6 bacterium OLB20]|uniref:Resolvase/invertase-type recombinase catalytic domain-containing protein n=1 Tax=candidate division WS6 bacterium OLB20 TaxID=1617426 RepID=A0A136LYZ4_9BACT|nr:MAG: hypothetical protein TR69_WS6001000896 [candidate division WS6 bacterium OLB20]